MIERLLSFVGVDSDDDVIAQLTLWILVLVGGLASFTESKFWGNCDIKTFVFESVRRLVSCVFAAWLGYYVSGVGDLLSFEMRLAITGMASYMGTSFLIALQDVVVVFIKASFDRIRGKNGK